MTESGDPLIGRLIDGRYRVRGFVAQGGMARVYRAEDIRLERDVALKLMHAHLAADDIFVERFQREAKQAARLSHPHLTAVLDQGRDGDLMYLAMEYLPNITLRDRLKSGGPMTPRDTLRVLDGVLQGLAAAHDAGLMHRDIKPENILLGQNGQVKLSDFGLARAVTASTTTNTLIGTVAYVSPELVAGEGVDARSDIYSIGVMMYEMLTGVQPYADEIPIQVAYRHVHDSIPPVSHAVPGMASDLDEIVQWAANRDPGLRPVDAGALLGELRHVAATLSDDELDIAARADGPAGRPEPTHALGRSDESPGSIIPHTLESPNAATTEFDETPNSTTTPIAGRRRGRWGLLAAAIAVVLLASAGGWYFLAGPGSTIATPAGLVGKSQTAAEKTLADAGLHAKQSATFSTQYKKGRVTKTDPKAGDQVAKGGTVKLVVSKGPRMTDVPDVAGKKLPEAQSALKSASLKVATVAKEYSDSVASGHVIEQSVKAGSSHTVNTEVDLTVSRGPRPVDVPDVAGMSAEKAERALNELHLKVSTTQSHSDSVDEGTVIGADPEAGTTVHHGDTVTLDVSLGPKQVAVPDVVGMQLDEAKKALEDKGFTVETKKVLGGYFNTVRGQDPAAGKKADHGSTVTITVV